MQEGGGGERKKKKLVSHFIRVSVDDYFSRSFSFTQPNFSYN
jgi:hypothetical protein